MKNLLNNLSQSEKNRILEQYNNSLLVDTSKFKKLLESKLGDVKPLLNEGGPSNNPTKAPFKNNEEANKFRQWVNQKYNQTAKNTLDLDPTGNKPDSYYNYHIQRAWNYIPGTFGYTGEGETLGQEYSNLSKTTNQTSYMDYWDELSNIGSETKTESKPTTVPFKNNTEGDEFRKWVNANYKDIAKSLDLNPIGKYPDSYNNATIQKALKHKVGNYTLGEIFMMQKMKKDMGMDWMDKISNDPVSTSKLNVPNRTWGEYFGETLGLSDSKDRLKKRDEELKKQLMNPAFGVPETLQGADRINRELAYINARSEFDGKPFFILDYYYNLVLAFDEKHKMIAWSYSVAGADAQPKEVEDYDMWCKSSGTYYNKIGKGVVILEDGSRIQIPAGFVPPFKDSNSRSNDNPPNPDVPKYYNSKHKYAACIDSKGRRFTQSYDPASGIVRSQSKGIYQTKRMYSTGYQKKGQTDTIPLKTLFGKGLGTAVHAVAPAPGRAEGMAGLKQSVTPQGITPEYITKVTKQKNIYDLSAGCFNVTQEFITNPEVERISKLNPFVFLMGDNEKDYLVKADPEEYFNNLEQGGVCRNPEGVANSIGQKIDKFNNFG
jgi:hypothetical protein